MGEIEKGPLTLNQWAFLYTQCVPRMALGLAFHENISCVKWWRSGIIMSGERRYPFLQEGREVNAMTTFETLCIMIMLLSLVVSILLQVLK